MRILAVAAVAVALASAAACRSACRPQSCLAAGGRWTSLQAQTRCGAAFFAANCAKCHGTGGRGTLRAPSLVGPCALQREPHTGYRIRTREFLTAADVVGFASAKMPPPSGAAGAGLPKEDYYAVVAFILTENGIPLNAPLSAESASAVRLGR